MFDVSDKSRPCLLCEADKKYPPEKIPALYSMIVDFGMSSYKTWQGFTNVCRDHALKMVDGVSDMADLCDMHDPRTRTAIDEMRKSINALYGGDMDEADRSLESLIGHSIDSVVKTQAWPVRRRT